MQMRLAIEECKAAPVTLRWLNKWNFAAPSLALLCPVRHAGTADWPYHWKLDFMPALVGECR
jgi:hypothetical protein